jgi:error-prone DNA polymerase
MPESPNLKLREVPPVPATTAPAPEPYAELDVTTNFSFLRGASHPDELVFRAAELGYRAIAITDRNSLAGVVRAYDAARQVTEQGGHPPKLIIGARLAFADAPDLLVYPTDRPAYARLCRLLTLGKRRADKGDCLLHLHDFLENNEGMLAAVSGTGYQPVSSHQKNHGLVAHVTLRLQQSPYSLLRDALGPRLSLAASALYGPDDVAHLAHLAALAKSLDIPLLATNHVHYHDPARRPLQDVLTCVRHGCTIDQAGFRLFPNDQRYLKPPAQMHRLFAAYPQALRRGLEIAELCHFSLDQLKYEYPHELVPDGMSPLDYLRQLTAQGARERYPAGVPEKVRRLIEHELTVIHRKEFEPYFLTVYDLVQFARSQGILCQGRGSAANSAVCYCLGVTSVAPEVVDMLFERFVSAARDEPPDIDIDFEHERREEVIQYIYKKYGRERAGMTAEVISYRGRSAVRDVGKALGLSLDLVDQMAKRLDWWHRGTLTPEMLAQLGLDATDRTVRQVIALSGQLLGFPRHLSQHVGGMVMTRGPLCEMVPIENASMEGRTVIEWDKDDIDTVGILKVDALALGMLTCISKALKFVNASRGAAEEYSPGRKPGDDGAPQQSSPGGATENSPGRKPGVEDREYASPGGATDSAAPPGLIDPVADGTHGLRRGLYSDAAPRLGVQSPPYELHTIPAEDPAVYAMMADADTIGVFQIESRAQMSMLPRLQPRNFYDIVIEVAIVRPGPIQGNMVHPYLRRRNKEEEVTYPSEALRAVLEKTLGVPLFQEQAMKIAMVAAGFTAEEADQLRRAMAAWRKTGAIERFHAKIVDGMLKNNYTREFAEQCFNQIKGFGEYGFPESHAASFARLVYVSAWIKRYHPAAFCAGLLNSQPMGFYAPAQLVRDAKEHGVTVLPVDVNYSDWDCTLEENVECEHRTSNTEHPASNGRHPTSMLDVRCSMFDVHPPSDKSTWGLTGPAVRLGFRLIKGLRVDHGQQVVAARKRAGRFTSIAHFHRATALPAHAVRRLAEADAFGSLGLSRRQAVWQTLEFKDDDAPLFDSVRHSSLIPQPSLPTMPLGQEVMTDYATTTLSLKKHPVSLVRPHLMSLKIVTAADVANLDSGRWVKVAGLVLIRQRPGTASGIVFETLEDETGIVNLIVRPDVFDRYHSAARHAGLLQADGYVERQGKVVHVMAKRLFDLSHLLHGYQFTSRDFH